MVKLLNLTHSDYSAGNGNVFMKLADQLRDDYRFANIANPEILEASGLEGKVILQRPRAMKNKFEEADIEYTSEKWTGENTKFPSFSTYT